MDQQKLALLKKALRNLSSAIDVLSESERNQLKELIVKGQVATEDDLRGYLSRLIASRNRLREREKQKAEERRQLARKQQAEEERAQYKKPEKPAEEEEAAIETDTEAPAPGGGGGQGAEGEKAKITGKVIDAKSRKPLPYARVRVIGTSFNEETETTGVFIWEEMPRGRQITFDITKKGYKTAMLQYRSSLDNEQHIVVKLVPQETKGENKDPKKAGGH